MIFLPPPSSKDKIVKNLKSIGNFIFQEAREKNTLLGLFEGVKFSLFFYGYPLVFKPIEYLGILLADPRDIAAMKLAAIMDRGTKKDFIDLFFLDKKGISIEQAFQYYDKKYKNLANNLYNLIKSLSYFDDAEKLAMPEMIEKVDWEEIKGFFQKEVVRIAKKYI